MVKILGSDGSYSHDSRATSFLIDKNVVIDAGNLIKSLGEECCNLEHIFISHTHFDHIVDLPFVLESYFECRTKPLKIYALSENISKLQQYLFNWSIWPNFTEIEQINGTEASLQLIPVEVGDTIVINNLEVTILQSNHTVPTCGYKVQKGSGAFVLSGDTYINDGLIDLINQDKSISSLLVDVSFSSDKNELAYDSKHMTPKLLEKMLLRLNRDDVAIYSYHQKPLFKEKIDAELSALGLLKNGGKRLETGDVLDLYTPLKTRQQIRNFTLCNNERDHLNNLFKIAQKMQTELNTPILLEMIVEQAMKFTHADAATLYLLDDEKNELKFQVSHNDTLNIHIDSLHHDVHWPNLPLSLEENKPNTHMVSVQAALDKRTIIISDIYDNSEFDFTGTKQFDAKTGYKSESMIVVPLLNHENDIIGVLQLINKKSVYGETMAFDTFDQESTQALASQASIAIVNSKLIHDLETSFELFIRTIALAIDSKSHHIGEHVRRVSKIADMIAKAIDKSDEGHYKDVQYSQQDMKQIHLAGLLHDVGKIGTPEYIMDKSKKLERIFDRIAVIDERIEILKRDVKIKYLEKEVNALRKQEELPTNIQDAEKRELLELDAIKAFLHKANIGTEYLESDKISELQLLAERTYQFNGDTVHFLRGDELENLSIPRGTLTTSERDIIRNHAQVTVDILDSITFPKILAQVPDIACNHHEKLDGTGYPRQLTADQLTLEDQIMILADMFEALSASNRAYKEPNSMTEIASILQDLISSNHMDKELVQFFFDSGIYREYAQSELKPEQQDSVNIRFN